MSDEESAPAADSLQTVTPDILDKAVAHLASLPPHLKDRYSAHLISDLAVEVDQLRQKLWQASMYAHSLIDR
jgi:hypothetical protein